MADQQQPDNTSKDPSDWTTGDEPATGAQMSYIQTMASEVDADVPEHMTKAEASQLIEDLQAKTNRGQDA